MIQMEYVIITNTNYNPRGTVSFSLLYSRKKNNFLCVCLVDDDKSQTLKSPSLLPSKPHPQLFSPTPEEEDEYEKEIDSD